MKALVSVKRLIDYQAKILVKPDGSGVETDHAKMSINPFDEIALEEAVRLKEKGLISEIIVLSVGDCSCQETLRHALALGADRALHVACNLPLQPLQVAQIMQAIAVQEQPELILLGKQAIDDDCNQTGQMLAGLLKWPQATFASKIEKLGDKLHVTREVDGGLETLAIRLPAIVTADLRLNEPRFASLPNIMKSKTKPLTTCTIEELNLELHSNVKVLHVEPPVIRQPGIKLNNIKELMVKLKEKGVLP